MVSSENAWTLPIKKVVFVMTALVVVLTAFVALGGLQRQNVLHVGKVVPLLRGFSSARVSVLPSGVREWLEPPTTATNPAHICPTCCYRYTAIRNLSVEVLPAAELKARGCKQRLPGALIIGAKKSGTTTLRGFLYYHPDLAVVSEELHFFTKNHRKGLQYYRRQMMLSTAGQITVEDSADYLNYLGVARLIKNYLPNVKLIAILRDPVQRAISDYAMMKITIEETCPAGHAPQQPGRRCQYDSSKYFISDTFEKSVLNSEGRIRASNLLVSKGVYFRQFRKYLQSFRRDQILVLQAEAFIRDPYQALKRVEQFLGLRDYFTPEHFHRDSRRGFYCLAKPIANNCMGTSKGRAHPVVTEQALEKLRAYYMPYNKALNEQMNVRFNWSS